MAIPCKNLLCAAALVAGSSLVTAKVVSQDHDWGGDQQAQMEMWLALAKPGKPHKQLQRATGEWSQRATNYMDPTQPRTSKSTATMKPILDGRFMLEHVKGEMDMGMGPMPFEGYGIFGYDNGKKKHVYAWMDNLGTMIMTGEGTADPTGNVITYYTEMEDPTGQMGTMRMKSVSTMKDDDNATFEMFMELPDGNWMRTMEIEGTRK